MKIRHPLVLRILSFFGVLFIRLWMRSTRFRCRTLSGPHRHPNVRDQTDYWLYAFWHENLLLIACEFSRPSVSLLIGKHADGELIATACKLIGYRTVRGSTTRGGVAALREMLRAAQRGHVVVTPDGPRGPRRCLQSGLIYLAARSGRAIVPTGLACRRAWRLRSWDRFALPWPFTDVWCVTGEPIRVPADADRGRIEAYRLQVEAAVAHVTAVAERLAGAEAVSGPESRAADAGAA